VASGDGKIRRFTPTLALPSAKQLKIQGKITSLKRGSLDLEGAEKFGMFPCSR
jgi:hypothetical protein